MEDVKDTLKGFLKKANSTFSSPSSSSSRKFRGQGRVLGSSSSSSINPIPPRSDLSAPNSKPSPPHNSQNPLPKTTPISHPSITSQTALPRSPSDGFDPFHPFITSGKRSINGSSLNTFECPICTISFPSEQEVTHHVDICINNTSPNFPPENFNTDLEERVAAFLSRSSSESSVETVLRLLRNIVKYPGNDKFRRLRMSNTKISQSICEVGGGVEFMEFIGFKTIDDAGEMWLVMELPEEEQVLLIQKAIFLLQSSIDDNPHLPPSADKSAEPVKVDRQTRVFFSTPERVIPDMDLPDSFYNLSTEELRRESDVVKKKIEESQLLIPRSLKEKQAKAVKRRYVRTIIRIQFPDGVILQGIFSPSEPTTALYEFARSALKQPGLEFELLHPVVVKQRVVPKAGDIAKTMEEEDLVPAALLKFKPFETDSIVYMGLREDLLRNSDPSKVDQTIAYA